MAVYNKRRLLPLILFETCDVNMCRNDLLFWDATACTPGRWYQYFGEA